MLYNLETGESVTVRENGRDGCYTLTAVKKLEISRKKQEYEIREILTNDCVDTVDTGSEYEIKVHKLKDGRGFYNDGCEFELYVNYKNGVDVFKGCKLAAVDNQIIADDCIKEIYTVKAKTYCHIGGY